MEKKQILSLSVHQLVDFLFRAGDIDSRIYNQETMNLGSKLHSSYQEAQGKTYLSEVPLRGNIECEDAVIALEGRADGIIVGGKCPIVDEIKSTVAPLKEFAKEQEEWHFGQAKCYAYLYAVEHGEKKMAVQITYISQIDPEEKLFLKKTFSFGELEKWIHETAEKYLGFQRLYWDHKKKRASSAKTLKFPYSDFRPGQREMAKYCYSVAKSGGIFFCEAPTGIGKTMSALFPTVKAFGTHSVEKIFYLTAKSSGREAASNAFGELVEAGFSGRDSLIRAKEKACFSPDKACNPDECPFAKGYFTKIRHVVEEAMKNESRFTPEVVNRLAMEHRICPFELQLDLSLWADVIICDYNYLFDPLVHLERYFGLDADPSEYVALIDEAHNLLERGREMYSSALSTEMVRNAKDSLDKRHPRTLKTALSKMLRVLEDLDPGDGETLPFSKMPKDLSGAIDRLRDKVSDAQEDAGGLGIPEAVKDLSRECYRFKYLYENYPENLALFYESRGKNGTVRLFCLDPSPYLKDSIDRLKGAVLFSATLSPIDYCMETLIGEKKPYLMLTSPFPKENFRLLIAPNVSIRYKDRANTYPLVAESLKRFVAGKMGNYFLFFPSYEYIENITPYLDFGDADIYVQESEMSDDHKTLFLSRFLKEPKKTTIGLLTLGGSFAEGIDLAEDRLIGVAVVGVGIPTISKERDMIRSHFKEIGQDGYAFAYRNPGINKVMQAVGRLIRSEKDVGAALLIDDRYLQRDYRELFARVWPNYAVVFSPEEIEEELSSFYEGRV